MNLSQKIVVSSGLILLLIAGTFGVRDQLAEVRNASQAAATAALAQGTPVSKGLSGIYNTCPSGEFVVGFTQDEEGIICREVPLRYFFALYVNTKGAGEHLSWWGYEAKQYGPQNTWLTKQNFKDVLVQHILGREKARLQFQSQIVEHDELVGPEYWRGAAQELLSGVNDPSVPGRRDARGEHVETSDVQPGDDLNWACPSKTEQRVSLESGCRDFYGLAYPRDSTDVYRVANLSGDIQTGSDGSPLARRDRFLSFVRLQSKRAHCEFVGKDSLDIYVSGPGSSRMIENWSATTRSGSSFNANTGAVIPNRNGCHYYDNDGRYWYTCSEDVLEVICYNNRDRLVEGSI